MSDDAVSVHDPAAAPAPPSGQASADQQREMEAQYAQMKRKMAMQKLAESIKHKIMVMSGKGGVGKSTVATGLALSLAGRGHKVGLLDIDITGPNVPKMLGLEGSQLHVDDGRIHPMKGPLDVKVISMAFLLEAEDTPVVWRGPIKLGAIQQFIGDVEWGELDFMIIDFPPGTSDEPLTIAQSLPNIDGIVIVTTPQEVALLDSRKSINFASSLDLRVLGVIENMSGYTIRGTARDNSGNPSANARIDVQGPGGKIHEVETDEQGEWKVTLDIFKSGGGETTASDYDVPFLGAIPFDPGIVRSGDDGVHRILAEPEGDSTIAFQVIVDELLEQIDSAESGPSLKII